MARVVDNDRSSAIGGWFWFLALYGTDASGQWRNCFLFSLYTSTDFLGSLFLCDHRKAIPQDQVSLGPFLIAAIIYTKIC
jgi:hypothetical protein